MARFYDLFATMTLLVAIIAFMFYNGFAADVTTAAPEPSVAENRQQIEKCIVKMTIQCGADIIAAILKGTPPTKECCILVLQNGIRCHIALTEADLIQRLKLTEDQVLPKSVQVWDTCVSLVNGSPTLSPS